jgi:NAD(P)-dependent dehydrogenase (short-subunit alcohol dehydrogenase family)
MPDRTKRIVITGVTRGLGRAMALELASAGHRLFGCGRSAENIERVASLLPDHSFSVIDVSDDTQVRNWAVSIIEEHGAPDLLLNNAAIMNRTAPLWTIPAGDFDRVIDVNVKGVANVIRHFVPAMVRRQEGIVVNFSSGWGRTVDADVAPYCATKHAIEGLSKALALELPDGMDSIPLNPGIIDTDMLREAWNDGAASFESAERWAKRAVPFILSLGPGHNGRSLTV